MAVVANQAVAFDKSMLTACPHLGDVLRPGLILDHAPLVRSLDLGDALMTPASWEEVEGFTWPYNRHFGQVPETSFSLPAQSVR
ncbi:MAG: hypothetical protein WBW14_22970 [Candidatus Acidiferrum sp.]